MPWYQSPDTSGYWGWHWKMDHFNPGILDENGKPEIASHFMPLIGPYDSKDWAVLEYQVLLMKLSGIDGVIVDWYGSSNYTDYPVINQATQRLFDAIKRAGLTFVICYEDQTVKNMIDGHRLDDSMDFDQGQKDLMYLQETWFQEQSYLKIDGRPLLLTFGPRYFVNPADWETLFQDLEKQPILVTLDQHYVPPAVSTFPWPPMWASKDGVLSTSSLENYLDGFYKKAENYPFLIAGAFPGFQDIYQEAGVGESYGYLDPLEGNIFETTFQKAIDQEPDIVQLITWNDYGEGTNIEPTEEYGYQYLEIIHKYALEIKGQSNLNTTKLDLRLPLQIFALRKTHNDPETNAKLDRVFDLLIAGDLKPAAEILSEFSR
jgi:hypothetical protein